VTVAVCDDEDMFLGEDLFRSHERGTDDVGGFILLDVSLTFVCKQSTADQASGPRLCTYAWNKQSCVGRFWGVSTLCQIVFVRHRRLFLEKNK
jgi:hypothetical protein